MRLSVLLVSVAASAGLGGCNLVFDLEAPLHASADAAIADDDAAAATDASPDDGGATDALDARIALDARECPPGAHDEDHDGIADDCDNCPHLANPLQDDVGDQDGVGDLCDPRPTEPGDRLVRFLGFDVLPTDVTLEATGNLRSFHVVGDELVDSDGAAGNDELLRVPIAVDTGTVTVVTRVRVISLTVPPNGDSRSVGVWGLIDDSDSDPVAPGGILGQIGFEQGIIAADFSEIRDTKASLFSRGLAPPRFIAGATARLAVTAGGNPLATLVVTTAQDAEIETATRQLVPGNVGLRTHGVSAAFSYLVVYAHQ